ncbi:MAG: riboflavin biosynthesis protein RibD [Flavipsychrobacter sp.]|jgi:diaminohydroxyphosphoribosylaminopyrimidine deaminase/5-amino-6-(5-phosphoribosylamino)uracil reductase|nr:riboflavin biosynthesis protein RibD [Flavipsychrobacter sp.]
MKFCYIRVLKDDAYIKWSFELAQRAKGHTAPNPMVGAVLVHGDRIIGEGWHHYYGADHAEVNCLKNVAEVDKYLIPESTMYVNLEPCAHHGITPPCAGRLVQEKIRRVVIANFDPNEKVAGKGIAILRESGTEVITGICEKEGLWLNRRFFCFFTNKRPYVVLKWARTKDGFIAPKDRSRLQITGQVTQKLVHKWRTEEAAIMVGHTTALMDNPQLTARHWEGLHPLRIVFDRKLQLPRTHNVFDNTAATWVINERHEILDGNIHSVKLRFDETLLAQLMQRLYEARILSVMVEGGAVLLNSFIAQGLWDEARVLTGEVEIGEGVDAPVISKAEHAIDDFSGKDKLDVFVNKNSAYQYAEGMRL